MNDNEKLILTDLTSMIRESNETNSTNDKKEVVRKYPQLTRILNYVFSPFVTYGITINSLESKSSLVEETNIELFDLLDKLSSRELTGHKAISVVNGFIKKHAEFKDTIYRIIDKNLGTRVSATIINKIFPDCIDSFKVQLADKYDKHKKYVDLSEDTWYSSRKIDGVRCITTINDIDNIQFFSRGGKEFKGLDILKKEIISKLPSIKNTILDGELCIIDKNGNEDFTAIVKQIHKKDHTIKNIKYLIFDILTFNELNSRRGRLIFSNRYNRYINAIPKTDILHPLVMTKIKSEQHLKELIEESNSKGWEGLIIRKDVVYNGRRTKDMLKIKLMQDAEYKVKDVVMGDMRIIENGKDVTVNLLSAIIIKHKGFEVHVGSGFTIEQRKYYKKHPEELIGKEVTVNYFSESKDSKGNLSLRFPVIKHIYDKERKE